MGCCQTLPHDYIMYHLEEIAKRLTDTPNNLEHQKPIQIISMMDATSIILSPHSRENYRLVGDSWDITSKYSTSATCLCVYDKPTEQMDTGVSDDLLDNEMDIGDNNTGGDTTYQ